MNLCVIQQPYAYDPADAEASVDFLISELASCDESLDFILLPEYSDCPSSFPPGESLAFSLRHAPRLEAAVRETAKRCNAVICLNFCANITGKHRNTSRVYNQKGEIAGEYYKQQLTEKEPANRQVDNSYALSFKAPKIVNIDGIKMAFLTCYDIYFNEYIAHLAYLKPDLIFFASHQRGEKTDIIEMQTRMLAFYTNAYVMRASVGMGENSLTGGCSMIVTPSSEILVNSGNKNGKFICQVEDLKWKYLRSDSFGGKQILNDGFIEKGRTPWSYRACGSSVRLSDSQQSYPRLCAHRGFSTVAPENSLAAFASAIALGADEIELDIRPSKDAVPMVIHDATLERVSSGTGNISQYTYQELKQMDFSKGHSEEWAGLQIASFEELLQKFPRQTIFNIHVKEIDEKLFCKYEYCKTIIKLLYKYDCMQHAYIASRANLLNVFEELAPELPRCMLAGSAENRMNIVEEAIENNCYKLQFFAPFYNKEMIQKAKKHGILCNLFYSDNPDELAELLDSGIDTILTNDFLQMKNAMDKYLKK